MCLDGKKILLGVTGGIAAYKAAYLLRLLKRSGADVRVILTEAACEFITPLTFETLSGKPVHIRMFGSDAEGTQSPVVHIDLAKWPDLVVIAPCTANTMAKLAHGKADDLLAAMVLAHGGNVVIAPAMNDGMWHNEATRQNLRDLSNRGFRVVPPEAGDLACGYEAEGRMAEPETIVSMVENIFSPGFGKLKVLVSAGGTQEDIDPVRVISNRSSGKMGFAVAAAARDAGADVTVVAANTSAQPPYGVRVVEVRTSAQMSEALKESFVTNDVLVMAAAVSDFKPLSPFASKVKGESLSLEFTRTEDILASLGKVKGNRMIVGFALETENAGANALGKMKKKNCDLMVVNDPNEAGAAFSHDTNVVTIYNTSGKVYESDGPEPKRAVARTILDVLAREDRFKNLRP